MPCTPTARAVVIDLTRIPKIASETADGLIRAIEAVQDLGATVNLARISAVIADTFVAIGVRFSRIKITADLQSTLEEAKNLLSRESGPYLAIIPWEAGSVIAARLPAFFR